MNISETFIRRPIATALMTAGLFASARSVSRSCQLPRCPTLIPTIVVSAQLPGASPTVMASTVATPLEDQFTAIPGLSSMTSTSGLGTTSITLQFDLNVSITAAGGFVEQAIQAASALLPKISESADLQGGESGRRANAHLRGSFRRLSDPAARPIRQHPHRPVALASERRRPGAIAGQAQPAVQVRLNPDALAAKERGSPKSPLRLPPRARSKRRATSKAATRNFRSTSTSS